jgi:mRNA interferase MazF
VVSLKQLSQLAMKSGDVNFIPDRGDIVWVILDPRVGHEQSGRRPALVLSGKTFNERTSLCVACPMTGNPKGLPYEIVYESDLVTGAFLPIRVKSIDHQARKAKLIEKCPIEVVDRVLLAVTDIVNG